MRTMSTAVTRSVNEFYCGLNHARVQSSLGKGDKISPRFMGPFEIVERKGPVAYRLALPDSLRRLHDVFHVSVLRLYISDPTHVIDMISLKVSDEGALTVESFHILDHRIRQLQCRTVDQVKV
jgi:hypothetical protein